MRDIKFRAWDLIAEKMYPVEQLSFYGAKTVTLQFNPVIRRHLGEVKLMQYTGLKDKNGFEIYEGDIVQRCWDDGSIANQFDVKWLEDNWGYNINPALLRTTKRPETTHHTAHGFKVIGNIYENPELVK